MRATRAVAGLLLLALFLGTTRAGDKCANCGLGEGVDACNCGNSVIRSEKLEKPEIFASPETIKNALKLKAASAYAARQTAPVYVLPTATYTASYAVPAATYGVAYNAVPAPSPVSYVSLTPTSPSALSPLRRGKNYAETKFRNNTSYGNGAKHNKDNEDLVSLLSLKPGTSIAPKFEPIGDLCHCNKCKYGNGDGVVGVVPARPGKLPLYKSRKPKSKSTTTPAPLPIYSTQSSTPAYPTPAYSTPVLSYSAPAPSYVVPTPSYISSAPSYSAPVPSPSYSASAPSLSYSAPASSYYDAAQSYIAPEAPSYSAPASFYSAPAASAQYAPAYQTAYSAPAPPSPTPTIAPYTADSAQYVPPYQQQSPQMIYVVGGDAPPSATKTYPYVQSDYDKNKREIMAPASNSPDSTQYARTYLQQSPQMIYQKPNFEKEEAKITPASYTQNSAQYVPTYAPQPVQMIHAVGDVPTLTAKEAYEKTKAEPEYQKDYKREGTITPVLFTPDLTQYAPTHLQQSDQIIYAAPASHTQAAPAEYVPTYQQLVTPEAPPAPESYAVEAAPPAEKSSKKSKKQVDYEKDEQEAQTLVEVQLQKERAPRYTADPVSVSMAYKIIADSQGKKYVPEDSLAYGHYKEPADGRVNKCVSDFDEEKLHTVDKPVVELKDDEYGNLQISYRDIGFGPVAPSKNRFVPKTDDSSNSALGPTIIYVPPPEDKDSLPCGPLGPTIPGYKPGGIIHGDKTSPVQEGTRRTVLVDEDEQNSDEYEGGNDKGGIIQRIKSSSCKCKKPE